MAEMDDSMLDIDGILNETTPPVFWSRRLTLRLLAEYKANAPKVGTSIKSLNLMYAIIARTLKKEMKIDITGNQVCNRIKSLMRKYQRCQELGKSYGEYGADMEEVMRLVKRFKSYGRTVEYRQKETKKEPAFEPVDMEIVDASQYPLQNIDCILQRAAESAQQGTPLAGGHDPLDEEIVFISADTPAGRSRNADAGKSGDSDKFHLLEKKIENREKSLEEKLKKNGLIEERNRLIASLLTKRTKPDVVDAIRKDRIAQHQEMVDLWSRRMDIEEQKLREKARRNNLLEERNQLMKILIEKMNQNSSGNPNIGGGE